jgi:competence protein ComEC
VKQVLEPGVSYNSSIYQEWCNLVEEKRIKRDTAQAGQEIDLGRGIKLQVLNPPEGLWQGTSDDVDNNGVVLRLSWGQISFLFTADIREEIEFGLIGQRANLRSTVLKMTTTQPTHPPLRLQA